MASNLQHLKSSYQVTRHDFGVGLTPCFEITCGKCRTRTWAGNASDMRLPPEAVFQIFRKLGWIVHQHKESSHRCPECQLHPQTSDRKVSVMATVSALTPRQLTGSEIRKVSDLLSEHFNERDGCFDTGWDDEQIAKTANVPRASVIRLREEGWGKIKVFADIESLKSEIGSVRQMVADLEQRVALAEKARR